MRRLLTDYGFLGYPLRKDFPLTGITEIFYSIFRGSVVYVRLALGQGFRLFSTTSQKTLVGH